MSLKPWWRHRIETFPRYWSFVRGIHQSPVTKARDAELWFFMRAWTNGWANIWDAGDLRRHRAHYDATIMILMIGMIFAVRQLRIRAWVGGVGAHLTLTLRTRPLIWICTAHSYARICGILVEMIQTRYFNKRLTIKYQRVNIWMLACFIFIYVKWYIWGTAGV